MKKSKYYIDLGMKIAFTKRMTEATKGLDKSDSKRGYTVFFVLDSYFYSKRSVESAIYVGAGIIVMVKCNIKYSARIPLKI